MGIPFPPPWDPGARCNACEDPIFSGVTPIFIYAFVQDLIKCPGTLPDAPDPNGVFRMTQDAIQHCLWWYSLRSGIWIYDFQYWFTFGNSHMTIQDAGGMLVFVDNIALNCQDHFNNQLVCGPPWFHGFSGGTVDCFW